MTNNNTVWTLEELMTENYMGLATTESAIKAVLEHGERGNDFYVGTDVKQWLSSFEILDENNLIEKFSMLDDDGEIVPDTYQQHAFEETSHGNSYNWCGHSSTNIDFRFLQDEFGNMYAYVRVHIGGDIRGNYTDGILIDLETDDKDCAYLFLEGVYEHSNCGWITIDDVEYSIDGDITNEYLRVYGNDGKIDTEIATGVYCWSKEEFEKELREVVEEALAE